MKRRLRLECQQHREIVHTPLLYDTSMLPHWMQLLMKMSLKFQQRKLQAYSKNQKESQMQFIKQLQVLSQKRSQLNKYPTIQDCSQTYQKSLDSLLCESQKNKKRVPGSKCTKYSFAYFEESSSQPVITNILSENNMAEDIQTQAIIINVLEVFKQSPASLYQFAPYDQLRKVSRAPFIPYITANGIKLRKRFPRTIPFSSCVDLVTPIIYTLIISGRNIKNIAQTEGIASQDISLNF
ncbi:UNKNOWN [Stylonychia lemnae]|uniref:Uncharacterized protein n=1 Tax=Stylonychia lemnae TaxID=5949 RepID=A0A078B6Z3_STYLE|nr:UNKNOWN [Stylonychia lemnae]|eukprot:CDW90290.1 UNKNOWN [Stylonychia lemnae]